MNKNIGQELDLVLNFKFSDDTALQFGWCTYFENQWYQAFEIQIDHD